MSSKNKNSHYFQLSNESYIKIEDTEPTDRIRGTSINLLPILDQAWYIDKSLIKEVFSQYDKRKTNLHDH